MVVSISLALNSFASRIKNTNYSGIVLIPFEVEDTGEKDEDGNQIVEFRSNSSIANEGTFVKNIEEVENNKKFKAVIVENPVGEATWDGNGKIPLLAVHGFMGRPDLWYDWCQKAIDDEFQGDESKFNLVPVMWPSNLFITPLGYAKGRKNATAAGKSFAERLSRDDVKTNKKSIVTVSMGNFVLKEMANAAQEKKQSLSFENIFMNAADVDEDIFSSVDKEGANIVDMLEKNGTGKVYVFHNENDLILQLSTNVAPGESRWNNAGEIVGRLVENAGGFVENILAREFPFPNLPLRRIGIRGAQNIAKEFEGKVENKDASKYGIIDLGHGYVFYPEVVEIYNDPSKNLTESLPRRVFNFFRSFLPF